MAGIDLTNARRRVTEKVLVDRCSIFRNPAASSKRLIDDTTGDPIEGPGDADEQALASNVPCAARSGGSSVVTGSEQVGDQMTSAQTWEVSLDYYAAPELAIGDRIVFTTSVDPMLLGVDLFVLEVVTGTLRASRRCTVGRRVGAYGQH